MTSISSADYLKPRESKVSVVDLFNLNHQLSSTPAYPEEMRSNGIAYVVFINFWHKLGISPFTLTQSPITGICKVKVDWKWKIPCMIFMLLEYIMILGWLRSVISLDPLNNKQLSYFGIANVVGFCFTVTCTFMTFWKKSEAFQDLVNFCGDCIKEKRGQVEISGKQYKKEKRTTLIIICIVIFVNLVIEFLHRFESAGWNWHEMAEELTGWSKTTLWLESYSLKELSPTTRDSLLGFSIFNFIFNYSLKAAAESLLIISTMNISAHLKHVERILDKLLVSEVLHEYSKLRELLDLHNEVFGLISCGLIFGYLPLQVYSIPDILQPKRLFSTVSALSYCSIPFTFLVFAAWFENKVTSLFEQWVIQDKRFLQIPEPHLTIFLYQLGKSRVGLHAFGFISFNTAFLGAVSTLILTFSVVIIQFQSQK